MRSGTRRPSTCALFGALAAFVAVSTAGISQTFSQVGDIKSRLGVAVLGKQGACLSIPRHGLAAGTPVALVQADDPPALAQAAIIGAGRGCPGVQSRDMVGYRLRIAKGTVAPDAVLIAVLGSETPILRGGLAQAPLEGGTRMDVFRACTSTDGVHVTVWDSASQHARRLWHSYYYLGQDLDPSCSRRETAE